MLYKMKARLHPKQAAEHSTWIMWFWFWSPGIQRTVESFPKVNETC